MITKFKVHGFKSIENVELELGNINVFIGANGSGKSNLLEAFGVLAAAAYGRVDEESLTRRGCRPGGIFESMFKKTPESKESREPSVTASEGNESYFAEFKLGSKPRSLSWQFQREKWESGGQTLVDRITGKENETGDPIVGLAALKLAEMRASQPPAIFLKMLSKYSIYSPDTPILRGLVQDPQLRKPLGLSGGRLSEAISEILNSGDDESVAKLKGEFRASMGWFEDVFAGKIEDQVHVLAFLDRFFREVKERRSLLSINEVNEGALYLLFVAVLCLHPDAPELFALDNADHGLNPLMARHLMTTMCTWLLDQGQERQIMMTTHNPLVLDGLPLQDDRVRLFTVDRDNRGATCVKRFLITDEHKKRAEQGWTLSRMWVNGLIGGVPNV